jgi:hypothetical protein
MIDCQILNCPLLTKSNTGPTLVWKLTGWLEAKRLELEAETKEGLWNENGRFFHRTAHSLILIFLSNTHALSQVL